MAKNTKDSAFINHLGPIRGLFNGEGNLLTTAFSLKQVNFEEEPDIVLIEASDNYSETLGNFQSQRIQVEFAVDVIDEWFDVSDIIVFIRPVASSLPY